MYLLRQVSSCSMTWGAWSDGLNRAVQFDVARAVTGPVAMGDLVLGDAGSLEG